ncbi:MAG: hypothetical protein EP329_18585 [Deltaproteobacteria bacterium]|nr:MAG: hypothetical protein EP329_18585 [Deltaproteobacteria bacterium]
MKHLVGSVSWNSNGWAARPTDEDLKRSGHGNVRAGYVGNECLNLAMEAATITKGWKYGAVEKFEQKSRFTNGGLVFLWSRNPGADAAEIVGVLAQVERLGAYSRGHETSAGTLEFNLRLPAVEGLAIRFAPSLAVDPERHLHDGDQQKKGPGQACGCYIDDASARRILEDAAAGGDDRALAIARLYGW